MEGKMTESILRQKHFDKQYVLRLPNALLEKLNFTSKKLNKPVSQIIRDAIEEYLKKA